MLQALCTRPAQSPYKQLPAGGKKLPQLQIQVSPRESAADDAGAELPFGLRAVEEVLGFAASTIAAGPRPLVPDLHIFGLRLMHAAVTAGGQGASGPACVSLSGLQLVQAALTAGT